MIKFVIVLVLATVALADHHAIDCTKLTVVKDIDFHKLEGKWAGIEILTFKDGHAFTPENDKRANICGTASATAASDTGMKVEINLWETDKPQTTEHLTATVLDAAKEKGRLSLTSDLHDRTNWEIVILDADADKHFVYMVCHPPNADGARFPQRAVMWSRLTDANAEAITKEEETKVKTHVRELLGLGTTEKPVRLATSCWSK